MQEFGCGGKGVGFRVWGVGFSPLRVDQRLHWRVPARGGGGV